MSASLAFLLGQSCERIWIHCKVLGCGRDSYLSVMDLVAAYGENATLVQVERACRCRNCGTKGQVKSQPVILHKPKMTFQYEN